MSEFTETCQKEIIVKFEDLKLGLVELIFKNYSIDNMFEIFNQYNYIYELQNLFRKNLRFDVVIISIELIEDTKGLKIVFDIPGNKNLPYTLIANPK